MELEPFPPIRVVEPGWQRRRVILSRKGDWWTARVPSLPGCTAHGRSRQEAVERMRAVLAPWMHGLEAAGRPVPPDVDDLDLAHLWPATPAPGRPPVP